jgi:RND family efflux transporter MFP subunit
MRNCGSIAPLVTILSAVLLVLASCSTEDSEQTREPPIRPVKLMTLSADTGLQVFRFPAVVGAEQYADLSFAVGGPLIEVLVVESQAVDAGDLIASLDQRVFRNQHEAARGRLQSAESEYQRALQLDRVNAIAKSALEQAETRRDIAKSQFDTAEKALEDTRMLAPFSGSIAQVAVKANQNVAAGERIVTLVNLDTLEVKIDMPAALVAASQEIENLGAHVILDTAPDARFPTELKEATLLADTASQTYRLTGTFEPPTNLTVLPGMNATVEVLGSRQSENTRTAIPVSAVSSDGDANFVWVVDMDSMTVSRREVTLLDGIGETAIVTEGLSPSDTIVTAGASFLSDGMQIRHWTE